MFCVYWSKDCCHPVTYHSQLIVKIDKPFPLQARLWPRGWVDVQLYFSMTTALEGGEWSAVRLCLTSPLGKTRYLPYRRLGGPQGRSGRAENFAPPGFDPRTVLPLVQLLVVIIILIVMNNNPTYSLLGGTQESAQVLHILLHLRRTSHCTSNATSSMNAADLYTVSDSRWAQVLNDFHAVQRVRGGAVGSGTALQFGRSRFRFPLVSLEFFNDIILPAPLCPWG